MKPEAKNWFKLAVEDFRSAEWLASGARYPHAIYHYCQALEKLLKGIQVEKRDVVPEKTHNLRTLLKNSGLEAIEEQLTSLTELNKHYARVRYRDIAQVNYNTKKKVEPIIKQAKEAYLWLKKRG
jgi:HEPN domain-containing protein